MNTRRLVTAFGLALVVGCRASSHTAEHEAAPRPPKTDRNPEQIRREGNHLVGSGSAYLRMHAHNPVDWYPWGTEALALAVKLDRPIFLSIGYVSCHWCHVMEHEVFEQDDVAAFLNAHFISIKVDREERPDLDAVYMDAVQTLTGRRRLADDRATHAFAASVLRWHLSAARPLFAGDYRGCGAILRRSQRRRESERTRCTRASRQASHARQPHSRRASFTAIARQALEDVDPTWGGFRGRTKFPTPIKWQFLLDAYRKWGDDDIARAIRKTLDAMAAGGVRDQVAGGFFRYGTEPTWTVPHFEKMLYDNAQLAALYLEAAAAFDEPRYRGRRARHTGFHAA